MNVIKSYKGKILIDGKDIKKHQEIIAEECGFLLEPSFCDYLSAYDNLKLLEEITINRSGYSVDDIATWTGSGIPGGFSFCHIGRTNGWSGSHWD